MPALELDAALVHMNRADARGNAQFLGPDLYFDDLFCMAAKRRFVSCEQHRRDRGAAREGGSVHTLRIHRRMVDGVIEAPGGAHFTECPPDYGRDEAFQREYAATRARTPRRWPTFQRALPRRATRRDVPAPVRAAEAAMSATSRAPRSARSRSPRLPRRRRDPRQRDRHACPTLGARLAKSTLRARPADDRRRRVARREPAAASAAGGDEPVVEGWLPFRSVFDLLWAGRRHVMMGATQIDRFGNQNIACIGDRTRSRRRSCSACAARPATRSTTRRSYWVPNHSPQSSSPKVDVVSGVGYDRAAALGPRAARFHEIRRVVSNLGVLRLRDAGSRHAPRLRAPRRRGRRGRRADRLPARAPGRRARDARARPPRAAPASARASIPRARRERESALALSPCIAALHTRALRPARLPLSDHPDRDGLGRDARAGRRGRRTRARFGFLAAATHARPRTSTRAIARVKALTPTALRRELPDGRARRRADRRRDRPRTACAPPATTARPTRDADQALKDAGVVCVPTSARRATPRRPCSSAPTRSIAQGGEGGGHTGAVPTSLLLPQRASTRSTCRWSAAGGFNDGRGLVAALAFGAAGIAMGTRFLLTRESPVPRRDDASATRGRASTT